MKNTDPVECTWALGDNLSEVSPLRRSSESSHNKGNHKRSKIVGTHYSLKEGSNISKQLYLCLEGSRARQGWDELTTFEVLHFQVHTPRQITVIATILKST